MTIEEYLNNPYWVIDILPKQVPADGRGQYFRIEKYFLEHPQIDNIYRKFTSILLKLNCYEDIDVSHDGEEWITNPAPHELEAALLKCMADKQMFYIILKSADILITVSGDDTYMTVYNPTEEVLELFGSLAGSEGLFMWKPKNSRNMIDQIVANKGENRPNPNVAFPNPNLPRLCFIKNVIKNPRIIIGDYTYYDDPNGADQFENHVTHFYDFIGDKLIIGKFCAIAKGVEFVMNGANHRMDCATTYPFYIMGGDWGSAIAPVKDELPLKGDTVVGNDVWIGQNVTIMPGVHIGDGAIIGTNSVVAKDIPPYAIAVGNPCRVVRKRFDDELIEILLKLRWWDKSIEEIESLMPILSCSDLEKVKEELKTRL